MCASIILNKQNTESSLQTVQYILPLTCASHTAKDKE
jgi:hypothetical protein